MSLKLHKKLKIKFKSYIYSPQILGALQKLHIKKIQHLGEIKTISEGIVKKLLGERVFFCYIFAPSNSYSLIRANENACFVQYIFCLIF